MSGEDAIDLGMCCACGQAGPTVRNVMMLPKRAPHPGTGWGCLVCGLPSDGAVAVVCDACLEAKREITEVCSGFPAENRRAHIKGLVESFDHDMGKHLQDAYFASLRHGAAALDDDDDLDDWPL